MPQGNYGGPTPSMMEKLRGKRTRDIMLPNEKNIVDGRLIKHQAEKERKKKEEPSLTNQVVSNWNMFKSLGQGKK